MIPYDPRILHAAWLKPSLHSSGTPLQLHLKRHRHHPDPSQTLLQLLALLRISFYISSSQRTPLQLTSSAAGVTLPRSFTLDITYAPSRTWLCLSTLPRTWLTLASCLAKNPAPVRTSHFPPPFWCMSLAWQRRLLPLWPHVGRRSIWGSALDISPPFGFVVSIAPFSCSTLDMIHSLALWKNPLHLTALCRMLHLLLARLSVSRPTNPISLRALIS